MQNNNELELDDFKHVEFEMLCKFDEFAQKHGLRYWLSYGTLIGAARHKGFIPWDDDIDLSMPKSDYYRLIDLINSGERICDYIDLDASGVDGCIPYRPFAKIFDRRTSAIQKELVPIRNLNESVWIDIFPLVGTQSKTKKGTERYVADFDFNQALLRRATWRFMPGDNLADTLRRIVAWLPAKIGGYKRWASACDSIQKEAPDMFDTPYSICLSDSQFIYPTDYFKDEPVLLEFEGKLFPCMPGYKEFLSSRYGNWRDLPPENERKSNHQLVAQWAARDQTSI